VSADVEPEIGTRLAVGRCVGYVVRRFAEGFAIQFDHLQQFENLENMISPPKDLSTYVERVTAFAPSALAPPPQRSERWLVD